MANIIANIKGATGATGQTGATGLLANFSVSSLKSTSNTPDLVFVSDSGKEGLFCYDAADTTTIDDGVNVLVKSDGKRFKRKSDLPFSRLPFVTSKTLLSSFIDVDTCYFDGSTWIKKTGNVVSNGVSFAGTLIRVSSSVYWERVFKGGVDFRFFGAKLDGVSDDTASIQAAFDANLLHYSFDYVKDFVKISDEIIINNYCTIKGSQKKQGTTIRQVTDNKSIFVLNQQFVEIKDIAFTANTNVGNIGVTVKASNTTIKNCWFENLYKCVSTPVFSGNSDENNYYENRIINCQYGYFFEQSNINTRVSKCTISGGKNAVWVVDTSGKPNEGVNVSDCLIYSTGDDNTPAIYVNDANFLILNNTMLDFCTGGAMKLNNSQFFKANNCYFSTNQSNGKSGVEFVNNCSDAEFTNCHFFDCHSYGVELTGNSSYNITFVNCTGFLNVNGDILNNGCKNVQLIGTTLKSTNGLLIIDNAGSNPSVSMLGGSIEHNVIRGTSTCEINMTNVCNYKTKKIGVATIAAGSNTVEIDSGFNLINFQSVAVVANCATQEIINSAYNYTTNKILIIRAGTSGSISVNYVAEVF